MITCFKFKNIIDITYHSNDDTLYLSLSDKYLQEHSPFKNSVDYMLEYEKYTTGNKEDLENNIVGIILKLYHDETFKYVSGCYFEHFINRFNQKIGVNDYDWDCEQRSRANCEQRSRANCEQRSRANSFLRVFKKQPLLKFTELIIGNSNNIVDEYGVISALYLMCKNPHFAELENAGFKFINMTQEYYDE